MPNMEPSRIRPRVDGKFFRLGEDKFFLKGVAYGPFAPNAQQDFLPSPEQTRRDFALLRELGANLLRVYHLPPRWFLDLALEQRLRLLVDIPWNKDRCFLDSPKLRQAARQAVRQAVETTLGHPGILAYCLVNEIPAEIVRWSGAAAVADFIDELALEAKSVDSECLCTFANYPPTEFLHPQNLDFFCYNVYLHHQRPYENYLARLQLQAGPKPLIVGEFGIDSLREGEARKCDILSWQIESSFRAGLAGTIVFSFTDEWFKNGAPVQGWSFGLTTAERQPKPSFRAVQARFQAAAKFPLPKIPKVSIVVASYNGSRTLHACLDSLARLNYPNYEVILVDDGSTDATPHLATLYPSVRYLRQQNMGLSVARNVGIQNAAGEIVAFTDDDCRADEDWLYYLVGDLLKGEFVGIGGPNFLPPEDSAVAAAVMASPGGPAHVMLNDREAEHIPGCNMAFYRWALLEIGGFDPIFRKAGDDVDICWRLQQAGFAIGFSPSAFVWHYRRSTPAAYLKQQSGYGEAEALLAHKHPEYFNPLGGSLWRGRIYSPSRAGLILHPPMIYHGLFGVGFFQRLYGVEPTWGLMFFTSLEYQVLVTLPLLVLSVPFRFLLPIALSSLLLSLAVCAGAAWQAVLPRDKKRFWSRPLIAVLFFLQPMFRGFARYHGRLGRGLTPEAARVRLQALSGSPPSDHADTVYYWTKENVTRLDLLSATLSRLDAEGWTSRVDTGWCNYDVELFGNRWSRLQITTVTEYLDNHEKLFRCRLKGFWSLPAKLAVAVAAGLELLVIGLFVDQLPWLWMLLLSLPILAWFFEQEEQNLQRLMAAFLDQVAAGLNLSKVYFDPREDRFVPALKHPYPDAPPKFTADK